MSQYTKHEIELFLHHQTPDAILVCEEAARNTEEPKIWLPKSLITFREKRTSAGVSVLIEAPEFLLIKKNLDHLI